MNPSARRSLRAGVVLAAAALALVGCRAEPAAGGSSSAPSGSSASPSSDASSSTTPPASASASATTSPAADIALPASCDGIYSAGMLAQLNQANPPLNDPGVTMFTTEVADALDVLDTAPHLRCSWGKPSTYGLASSLATVTAAQTSTILGALRDAGFSCTESGTATRCERADTRSETPSGEVHYLQGNGWLATHWIGFDPQGYTNDIVATVW